MRKEDKEILSLTAQEVLQSIFDLAVPFFEASSAYRVNSRKYLRERSCEKELYRERIRYLKRTGLINTFIENKEKYLELTPKGIAKVKAESLNKISIHPQDSWDGKWRVVIFDIKEKHRSARDALREKLIELGFEKIQNSVYVYPFECTGEITRISRFISQTENVLIMISEIIQGEESLIHNFIERGILNETMITAKFTAKMV